MIMHCDIYPPDDDFDDEDDDEMEIDTDWC